KKLSKKSVWNLLTNPYYYGVIRYNDKLYTENIQHEPLISKALFERVQEALGRRRKGIYRRHLFTFGGCVMVCGDCGCPVTDEQQSQTWVEDCERFFVFTQELARRFSEGSIEEKRAALFLICSKLTLRDKRIEAEFRDPFAAVAGFPLAGKPDETGFERRGVL